MFVAAAPPDALESSQNVRFGGDDQMRKSALVVVVIPDSASAPHAW
jgi:hypothetical protein